MNTSIRSGAYIQTYTGGRFYPLDPRAEDINLIDIAHALSNICRFTGHTKQFYSVAQHSVIVSQAVPPEHAMAALLHDASEAYLNDMSRPIKSLAAMAKYKRIEHNVMNVIADKFGFTYPLHESIKQADERALFTEKRDLMTPLDWGYEVEPYPFIIEPLPPEAAKKQFIDCYHSWFALSGVIGS